MNVFNQYDSENTHDSDGAEDFDEKEATHANDEYDKFSKLMKDAPEFSINLLLEKTTEQIQSYENAINALF